MGNHFEGTTNWTDLDVSALASQWLIFMYVLFGGTPYIVTMLMLRKQKDEDTSSHDYDWRSTGGCVLITSFASWHILDTWFLHNQGATWRWRSVALQKATQVPSELVLPGPAWNRGEREFPFGMELSNWNRPCDAHLQLFDFCKDSPNTCWLNSKL